MNEYKVHKRCQNIIDRFWSASGHGIQNFIQKSVVDQAMIFMYRTITEKSNKKK